MHPSALLALLLQAPEFSGRTEIEFLIRASGSLDLSAVAKGGGFRFGPAGAPTGGTVSGLVIYEAERIVAQVIGCSIPAERLAAARADRSATSPESLTDYLGMTNFELVLVR